MQYTPRKYYIQKIRGFINTNLIKVIVGQRRVGKSFILFQLMDYIEENFSANIIYINKENFEFKNLTDAEKLVEYVESKRSIEDKNYLFIDEIQEIEDFQIAIRHFALFPDFDIYCTGSNATILSGELATLLSGRYVEINISPLTYGEFLNFNRLEDSNEAIRNYILWGGLPFIKNLGSNSMLIEEYLRNIRSTIVLKDIVQRNQIRNVNYLENLIFYLAQQTGSLISAKKISDYLKSQRIDMSPQLVLNYIDCLCKAFLINRVKRYDLKGKRTFEISEKFYFEDWGLMNAVWGFDQFDISKTIDNVVFSYLQVNDYEVQIGKLSSKEVDFVASKNGSKMYVQVCYLLSSQDVIDREFGNLLEIRDNYPKYVVSMDEFAPKNIQGVQHLHLREFLLKEF
ncbi:MAG: ATP-binding protein [Bacteroidetes bacterium]|nr:ATP-binding protein [Bacteroidota bacterium]